MRTIKYVVDLMMISVIVFQWRKNMMIQWGEVELSNDDDRIFKVPLAEVSFSINGKAKFGN